MNDSYLLFQAQFLNDSLLYKSVELNKMAPNQYFTADLGQINIRFNCGTFSVEDSRLQKASSLIIK